jgi:hypothetical protein
MKTEKAKHSLLTLGSFTQDSIEFMYVDPKEKRLHAFTKSQHYIYNVITDQAEEQLSHTYQFMPKGSMNSAY